MSARKLVDIKSFQDLYVIIGFEKYSAKYALAIPESAGFRGYLEYYQISKEEYELFSTSEGYHQLSELTEKCRKRLCDDRLMEARPL